MPPVKKESSINNFMDPELIQFHQTLISDIANVNIQYLGWSITLILAILGLHYLFNVRPLQNKLEKQEKRLQKTQDRINEQSSDIKSAKEEVKALSKKLGNNITEATETLNSRVNSLEAEVYRTIAVKSQISPHEDHFTAILFAVKGIKSANEAGAEEDSLHGLLNILIESLEEIKSDDENLSDGMKKACLDELSKIEIDGVAIREKVRKAEKLISDDE